ncbi:MAG TPA: amidohydrolase family protein [Vicinamibacterales bacterium]|nr:amidohydrolase family protein [Vicinamibacterales bacterium]
MPSEPQATAGPTVLHDSHCHFLSSRFYEALGREKYGAQSSVGAEKVAGELGWEVTAAAEALATRWISELDRHGVTRAGLIASVPGDEESVAAAVARHPSRFVGFFALNAAAPDAHERARRAFGALGLRCVCLFPAMHRYRLDDVAVVRLFEIVAEHGAAVFVHCGYLSIEARTRLGLRSSFDIRLGDPLALAATAVSFPTVPVIIPHFGGGFFREALMAGEACPTIHFDTSSSNSWVRFVPGLTLTEVFRRALAVVGPERLIFGTDSSFFPRGWRRVIHGAQRTILDELGAEPSVSAKIFSGNFDRLFTR